MQPRFRAMILSMPCPSGQREESVLGQLQITFAHLALTKYGAVNPWAFWRVFKDFDGQPMDTKEHQDCQEFFVSAFCDSFGPHGCLLLHSSSSHARPDQPLFPPSPPKNP